VDNVILNEYANFQIESMQRNAPRQMALGPGASNFAFRSWFDPPVTPETASCLKLGHSSSAIRKTLHPIGYPSGG
jgi:hypothetical protein